MQSKEEPRLIARQDSEKSSTLLERLEAELERLEAENKHLRAAVVELMRQIRAIADGDDPGLR